MRISFYGRPAPEKNSIRTHGTGPHRASRAYAGQGSLRSRPIRRSVVQITGMGPGVTDVVNPAGKIGVTGPPDRQVYSAKRFTPSSFHSTPLPGLSFTVTNPSVARNGSARMGSAQSDHSSQSADSLTRSSCADTIG